MIISGLLQLLYVIAQVLLLLLPTYTPPPSVGLTALQAADFVLPIAELALVMGAVVAYATGSLGYTLIMRVLKFLRGAG